ncbi:MAG: hypothetical protein ACXABY_10365, partial [Candidatus Thorarchaeota archaeon]
YEDEKAGNILFYLKSKGLRDAIMVSFMILYAEGFVAAAVLNMSNGMGAEYLRMSFMYLLFIMLYGFFYPWYIPERYKSENRELLEMVAGVSLFLSPINPYSGVLVAAFLLGLLWLKTSQFKKPNLDEITDKQKERGEQLEKTWYYQRISHFLEAHPTLTLVFWIGIMTVYIAGLVTWLFGWDTLWISLLAVPMFLIYFLVAMIRGSEVERI